MIFNILILVFALYLISGSWIKRSFRKNKFLFAVSFIIISLFIIYLYAMNIISYLYVVIIAIIGGAKGGYDRYRLIYYEDEF